MTNIRFKAFETASTRKPNMTTGAGMKSSDYYGENTFNQVSMREFLTEESYRKLLYDIGKGLKIDRKVADQIATSLKNWAISKGATHYTHWFQPLTGATAEKHDAFIHPVEGGKAIEEFHGDSLIQQEPDASSFPHGGIRNTFEARGYTAWDPTSPAFLLDSTLCIPSVFISYTGEALDNKTPLLRAMHELDKAAVDVYRYFDKNVTKIYPTLGWEQEYFLVDLALYHARPDLALSGRTLFGHASAKDQQLSDHYFGIIPERVIYFMKDFEYECHRIGIPVKTRHNEVAPNQFEVAPVYENVNLAVDHNQLLMHIIKKVALRHDFIALMHEKPFARINGSGKHNNWSMETNTGVNLLSPGKDERSNFRFVTFLVNIVKAVHDNADLLRASIASSGNEHRLGAHEAPPAIMSVFLGDQITKTLDAIVHQNAKAKISKHNGSEMNFSIPVIPEILFDNTDRNRTSPFAFTGNKFEFRAVGSSANCSKPMMVLSAIVANQLKLFRQEVEKLSTGKMKKDDAIFQVIRKYIKESKKIRFEGNSYCDEWITEAAKRGLNNIKSTPEALKVFKTPSSVKLFSSNNILTERELSARYEIDLENYTKKIQIEARVIGDLATNHIIPIAIRYQNLLIQNVKGLKDLLPPAEYKSASESQVELIRKISMHISEIKANVENMVNERKTANVLESVEEMAMAYNKKVLPYFEIIREHVDELELMVDDELWPLPKYREMLFIN